jgi:uncharacterized protein HemX
MMNMMRIRNQMGQTGIAVLALVLALVALGVAGYAYVQTDERAELRGEITRLEGLIDRGRQETADAVKRLEERIREREAKEQTPGQ